MKTLIAKAIIEKGDLLDHVHPDMLLKDGNMGNWRYVLNLITNWALIKGYEDILKLIKTENDGPTIMAVQEIITYHKKQGDRQAS